MPKNTPGPRPAGNWKPVSVRNGRYEGAYEVSDDGRVWSVRRPHPNSIYVSPAGVEHCVSYIGGHVLQQSLNSHGYPVVGLSVDGKAESFQVHRLVLEAFVGPRPDGMEACHGNDDPTDNRLANLRWDSHVANIEDRERHRKRKTHCRHGHEFTPENSYFSPAGVRSCRTCYRERDRIRGRKRRAAKRDASSQGAPLPAPVWHTPHPTMCKPS